MGRTCVVSCVVEPLPLPIWKVAGIDLKVAHASFRRDSNSVVFSDRHAASAIWSSCIVKRKRVETTFQLRDIRGIYPLTFWPKFLNGNPQLNRAFFRLIYHGTSLHAALGEGVGAAAPTLLSPSRSAAVCKCACNVEAHVPHVVRAYSRSGCLGG